MEYMFPLRLQRHEQFCHRYLELSHIENEDERRIQAYKDVYKPSETNADSQIRDRVNKYVMKNPNVPLRIEFLAEGGEVEKAIWTKEKAKEEALKMYFMTPYSSSLKDKRWEMLNTIHNIDVVCKTEDIIDKFFRKLEEKRDEPVKAL